MAPPSATTPNGANGVNGHGSDGQPPLKRPNPGAESFDRFHAVSSSAAIAEEEEHAAHNYPPLPVVLSRGQGPHVWDVEGKRYLDFLSAYSAVNQGHCQPALVATLAEQAGRLTLSSRAFYNDVFPRFATFMTRYFGYEMVLPMNTGAEAVETAIKVARKWAYKVKGVPPNEALVFCAADNFHGRTMTAVSLSTDPESRTNYGPFIPNLGSVCPSTGRPIPYDDLDALRAALEAHGPKVAAFLVEPIQGEAGIVVPSPGYLKGIRALCDEYNCLFICDEIQTGIARTGKMLCCEHDGGIRPNLILLGKAISGGMYPVSCVIGSKDILGVVEPGTHGSTYGGNPLGCAVAMRALEIVEEEGLVERAERLGRVFRTELERLKGGLVQTVRGMGLLNAIVIDETKAGGKSAWDLCLLMKEKGLLVSHFQSSIARRADEKRPSRRIGTSSASPRRWSSQKSSCTRLLISSRVRSRSCRHSVERRERRLFRQRSRALRSLLRIEACTRPLAVPWYL